MGRKNHLMLPLMSDALPRMLPQAHVPLADLGYAYAFLTFVYITQRTPVWICRAAQWFCRNFYLRSFEVSSSSLSNRAS